jgi:alpha-galactosidase
MPRIAFVGAGSTVFTRNLVGDLLSMPELADETTFALMDVDAERLAMSEGVTRQLGAANVEATLDRRRALDGADYVVTSFQVGGLPATRIDFDVPRRFGLRQTIGDTLGVGGIVRALRTVPVLLAVARDMEELCPDALLLQYVNPMAILCWALAEASSVRSVGLCHSVQHTAGELAPTSGSAGRSSTTTSPASTTSRSSSASSATARTSTRRCTRSSTGAACPTATASATRSCATSATS